MKARHPRIACAAAGGDAGPLPDGDLILLPGRAALVPASRTLLGADLHLGKAATFRQAGIPVPEGSAEQDLARLAGLVAAHSIARVLVVGDLLHAVAGCTPAVVAQFRAFRDRLPDTGFVLVLGNHDVAARRFAADLGLDDCLPVLDDPPYRFVHIAAAAVSDGDGTDATDGPADGLGLIVAGHVHPRVVIRSRSGDRFAERCFHLDGGVLTLPAFGSFTGGQTVPPSATARVWLARDDGVLDVTGLVRPASRHFPPGESVSAAR